MWRTYFFLKRFSDKVLDKYRHATTIKENDDNQLLSEYCQLYRYLRLVFALETGLG